MILLAWRAADTQADGFLLAICTQSVQSQDQRSECLGSQVFPMELCSWPRSGYSCPCWSLLRGKASGAVRLGFALLEAHSAECWAAYTEERTDLGLSCRSWGCFYLFMALGDTFPASSHNSGVPQWFQASGAAHCCLWNGLDLGFGGPFSLLQAMPWCCRDEAQCAKLQNLLLQNPGRTPAERAVTQPGLMCRGGCAMAVLFRAARHRLMPGRCSWGVLNQQREGLGKGGTEGCWVHRAAHWPFQDKPKLGNHVGQTDL